MRSYPEFNMKLPVKVMDELAKEAIKVEACSVSIHVGLSLSLSIRGRRGAYIQLLWLPDKDTKKWEWYAANVDLPGQQPCKERDLKKAKKAFKKVLSTLSL